MLNIILAFDEEDTDIGSFNIGCKEDIQEFFRTIGVSNNDDYNIIYVSSDNLNYAYLKEELKNYDSFIFVAYSHGEIDKLLCKDDAYVQIGKGIGMFRNSFFYTVSCLTGAILGEILISNGCHVFFGYKELFNSWLGYKEFSICANYGFFKFIEGHSVEGVYTETINQYNEQIDNMYLKDFLVASLLMDNRNGFVKLGKGELVINDIHID